MNPKSKTGIGESGMLQMAAKESSWGTTMSRSTPIKDVERAKEAARRRPLPGVW